MSSSSWPWASLSICLAVAAAPATAAASPLGLHLGLDVAFHSVRDDTLVPLAFSGPRPALVPRFFAELGPGLLLADARLGLGYAVDRELAQTVTLNWAVHASYLLPVREGSWHLALGPALGWDNETFWYVAWDDAHLYWMGTRWLGPGARAWHWLSDDWRLDLAAELALIGWQSRTPGGRRPKQETSDDIGPYFSAPTRDPELGWIGDYQLVRLSAELFGSPARTATPTGWGFGSEVTFTRSVEPALAFVFSASLRASYGWSL